jgi:hypothetical protein
MNCYLCLREKPSKPQAANAQCSDCGQVVCYDHVFRVERGQFVCLACYAANESRYRGQQRPIERPHYRTPREPKAPDAAQPRG